MEEFTIVVEQTEAGERIDRFLAANMEGISRSQIKRLLEEKRVLANGKPVKASYPLQAFALLTVQIPEAAPLEIVPEDIPLEILFEDKDVIVFNKPQGMVVHPAPGHFTGTAVNALLYHCKGELSGINGVLRPGIVHRIDKDTSGILMAAKTNAAHQSLALQLAEHSITRKYHAICFNRIREEAGTVDAPIGRHPQERKKMAVTQKNSRRAVTHYKILEPLRNYTYFEAQLETGRTHQIRVHMAYIGNPLLGDTVYGPKKQPFPLQGQVLHAKALGFLHPTKGEYMEFTSELPEYFQNLLERLRQ